MPFPSVQHVIYRKNPLAEVVCQLRFPTILRIDTEIPASFQERIRQKYPGFHHRSSAALPSSLPPEIAKLAEMNFPFAVGNAVYEFVSADELWTVSLTHDFLALTARKYERWEDFKDHFAAPFEALLEIYQPTYFSRTGLRYQDVIRRSVLGLAEVAWAQLLQPYIASELSASDIENEIEENFSQVSIRIDEQGGRVRLRHGLIPPEDMNEVCYIIDSDFFTEQRTETYVDEE